MQRRSVLGMHSGQPGTHVLADLQRQRCRRGLDEGHIQAEFARRRSHFGADKACPDDDQPRTWPQLCPQGVRIIEGAQHMRTLGPLRARQPTSRGAGCYNDAIGR